MLCLSGSPAKAKDEKQGDKLAELFQRGRELSLHVALADAESLGYLAIGQSFLAAHDEHLAPLHWHAVDLVIHFPNQLLILHVALRVGTATYLLDVGIDGQGGEREGMAYEVYLLIVCHGEYIRADIIHSL